MTLDSHNPRRVYTVSELTSKVKGLLEEKFPFIWITGEISNFRVPASGHHYFALKDEKSRINALMFRPQIQNLTFEPEDGMQIIGLGRLSVYAPRGTYQIILEYIEPKGVGALRIAFEQLKKRLFNEGLFDEKYKKPLPFLPKKISIVTSPTGAVVHDIIQIVGRRFPNVHIEIVPSKVQGEGAEDEIISGIDLVNVRNDADVAIIARGGGSLEDLNAFNSEAVARAIFASEIPIISAVGHETDFTIADFVSDLRAPTPSAAAELVVPSRAELVRQNLELFKALIDTFTRFIDHLHTLLNDFSCRLINPRKKIEDLKLKLDDINSRFIRIFFNNLSQTRERFAWRIDKFRANGPLARINNFKESVAIINYNLFKSIKIHINNKSALLREFTVSLDALSPLKILDRGYSITRTIPERKIIKDPKILKIGQYLDVIVSKGQFISKVERKNQNGETEF